LARTPLSLQSAWSSRRERALRSMAAAAASISLVSVLSSPTSSSPDVARLICGWRNAEMRRGNWGARAYIGFGAGAEGFDDRWEIGAEESA
jgi:hypothetical protein